VCARAAGEPLSVASAHTWCPGPHPAGQPALARGPQLLQGRAGGGEEGEGESLGEGFLKLCGEGALWHT